MALDSATIGWESVLQDHYAPSSQKKNSTCVVSVDSPRGFAKAGKGRLRRHHVSKFV